MACCKKYKALILKYVPYISKYMACIFCDKPCVFSHIPHIKKHSRRKRILYFEKQCRHRDLSRTTRQTKRNCYFSQNTAH